MHFIANKRLFDIFRKNFFEILHNIKIFIKFLKSSKSIFDNNSLANLLIFLTNN